MWNTTHLDSDSSQKRNDLPHNFTLGVVLIQSLLMWLALPRQSARSSIEMAENNDGKRGRNNKIRERRGMIEWAVCGEEGGKRNRHTHAGTWGDSLPWLLSAQMLDWGGAVNQRACVCKYARMCVCDSVWQWSEGYLVMTAADTMGPFLYLSIQCSLSPPSHLSSCPPPHPYPLPSSQILASPFLLFTPFSIFHI